MNERQQREFEAIQKALGRRGRVCLAGAPRRQRLDAVDVVALLIAAGILAVAILSRFA